jgi:hypothetical protein
VTYLPEITVCRKDAASGLPTGDCKTTTDLGQALIDGKFDHVGKIKGPILRGLAGRALAYFVGREPVMRISTSRLALCCQSGLDATLDTPIKARTRSNGSRSLRISPLAMARSTNA